MSWPNTVSLITGTVGDSLGSSGESADRIYVAVTPVFGEGVHRLLHAATGTVWDDRAVVTSGTPALFVQVPHVDQSGFVDGLGNEVTDWYYLVQVITRAGTGKSQWSYYWQPRVADGDTVDLDTLGDGVLVTDPVLVYTPGRDAADAREAAAQALAAAQEAEGSVTAAAGYAEASAGSASAAEVSAGSAATSVTDALAAASDAESAANAAEDSAVLAEQAATDAGSDATLTARIIDPTSSTHAALQAAYAGRKDIARSTPRFLSKLQAGRPAVVAIASDSASTSINEWWELLLKKLGEDYPNTFVHGTWWNKASDAYDPEHTLQAGATPSGTTVLNDTFTRTASEVVGTTPDVGVDNWQQWTVNSLGNWSIDGADLVSKTTVNRGEIRNAIGQGEHHLTVAGNIDATATGTARFTDAYLKYVDHNNNLIARLNVDTGGRCQLYLYKQIAGVLTELTGHVNNPGTMGTNTASNEFTLTFGITDATVTATIGGSTMTGTLTADDLAALEGAQYVGLVASGRAGDKIHAVSASINVAKPVLWFRNGSVGGSILQYQLDRIAAMYPEPVDTMFIASSHNYGSTTDVPTYWAAIDAFIAGYRALYPNADTDFVICSQNPRIPPAWASINHADRNASLAAYAKRRGYGYAPVVEGFSKVPNVAQYIQADGVHPTEGDTDTGSSIWRDIVYSALYAMLTQLVGTKVATTASASGALAKGKHHPVNATSGARTMTLPTSAAQGTTVSVEKTDSSTNLVTITGNIRGVGSSRLSLAWQYESITFVADAAGSWWPVAGHKTKTALDNAYAGRSGQDVAPLTAAELVDRVNTTYPIGSLAGLIYGSRAEDSKLYTTTDQGRTWTLWNNNIVGAGSAVQGIWQLDDGEVLVSARADGLYRSSGWAANHLTATWTRVFQPSTGAWVLPWHVSVYGSQVVVGEYGIPKTASDKLAISTDMGVTFTTRFSLNTTYAGDQTSIDNTHWHAAAVDPYKTTGSVHRIWACYGDGPRAVIYTDDNGATWTTYSSFIGVTQVGPDIQPTTITPIAEGIVLGTDRVTDGHQLIDRAGVFSQTYVLRSNQSSLFGFANRTIVAPGGELYTAWTTSVNGLDVPITGVTPDGRRGAEVYTVPGVAGFTTNIDKLCIDSAGWMLADVTVGGVAKVLRAKVAGVGASSFNRMNAGGVFGGKANSTRDVAVGAVTTADGGSVAVGAGAAGGTDRGVAVGWTAAATGSRATAVGAETAAAGAFSTALGHAANTGSGSNNTDLGRASGAYAAGQARGVAVGDSAKHGTDGVAVGYTASVQAADSIALGSGAVAAHARAVALGKNLTTTAADQVALGSKHIEVSKLSAAPAAPAADTLRWYAIDDGTGATRPGFRTAAGAYVAATKAEIDALQAQINAGVVYSGEQSVSALDVSGLTGATTASRYVGGTTGGPPASGTFVAGDFVITTLGGIWICTTGGSPGTWVPAGDGGFVRKTSDTARTATITGAADPELARPVAANAVYTFRAFCMYDGPTAADIAFSFTAPTGSTIAGGQMPAATTVASTTVSPKYGVFTGTTSAGSGTVGALSGTKLPYVAEGTLRTGGTAGTFALAWAQGVSDPGATTVYADSWLELKRRA